MTLEMIVWGAVITGLVGTITYVFKRYFDSKLEKALAGQAEVIRKQYVDRFDTLVRMSGMLAEIDHCLEHLKKHNESYSEQSKDWCMKIRSESRASIALVGQQLVEAIKLATDAALDYTDTRSPEAIALWKKRLAQTYILTRLDITSQQ